MRIINIDYDKIITTKKPMKIYLFSDTHIAHIGFDEKLLKKHINMCRKENAYWIHLGDWCEAISPKDKRYDVRNNSNPVLTQYQDAIELFEPIKDMGIAILSGNHDEKIAKEHGDYVAGLVARNLEVPYLGYTGFVNIRLWDSEELLAKRTGAQNRFIIHLHHGHTGGRKTGGKMNSLQDMAVKFDANLYAIGHGHTYVSHIDAQVKVISDKRNISKFRHKRRNFIGCPSYYRVYEDAEIPNYAEKAAYQPQAIGCVKLELYKVDNGIGVRIIPMLE